MAAETLTPSIAGDLPTLPKGWTFQPLKNLVNADRGICYGIVQPGSEDADGVPIVRVNNIRNARLSLDDAMRVSPEIEAKYKRSRLVGGEVLLSLVGSLGETAIVPPELAGWNVARAVGVIPVLDEYGGRWVHLCLRSPLLQHCIRTWATTTVQATLNLGDVARLPIPVPPPTQRSAIAGVLGALDDKIEVNRRMARTLEAAARTLFESWFVRFEHPGGNGPAPRLVDSAMGAIPEGWAVRPLDTIARFLNGLALQKFPPKDGEPTLPVIKISQLRKGDTVGADQANTEIGADYVVSDGDMLFSWSGSLECVLWTGGPGALNQHLFKVTSAEFPQWFVYLWVQQHLPEFRHIAAAKATTMGHIQRHHLTNALVAVPPTKVLVEMGRTLGPMIDAIPQKLIQAQTLAAMRDALLPRLISGELEVPEVMLKEVAP